MSWTRRMWLVTGVWMALSCAAAAHARVIVVPPRPGQVGLGLSGLYGTLLNGGSLGNLFGSGPGLSVRLRYRMRYERGFGLTFENHGLDVRSMSKYPDPILGDIPPDTSLAAKRLNVFLSGVDFYQMFGTRTRTTRMLSVGVGIAHPSVTQNDKGTNYPWTDGAYVSAGAGIERFFWQSWAWDLGARYQAIFLNGRANHDLQVSAGLVFYASL